MVSYAKGEKKHQVLGSPLNGQMHVREHSGSVRQIGADECVLNKKHIKQIRVDDRVSATEAQFQLGLQSATHSSRLRDQLHSFCEDGQLDKALDVLVHMDQQGTVPSVNMYRSLLKVCTKRKALAQAKQVHLHLVKNGLESTRFLGESVVSTLVKCGSLEDALDVFERLPTRTVYSWTALICGYTNSGQSQAALRMYRSMREAGLEPDKFIFVNLLKACANTANLDEGRRVHAEAALYSYETDIYVGTCLLNMYAKCGSILDAQSVFDGLSERDVVSWNAMLAAYVHDGQAEEALRLYGKMFSDGVSPDDRTFVSVLQACGVLAEGEKGCLVLGFFVKPKSLGTGKAIHGEALRRGYDCDVFVGSTLVSMYGKCGSVEDAQHVFQQLLERNVVSWSAMITAITQQGQAVRAFELYVLMLVEGVSPDAHIFVTMLQACGMLAEVEGDTNVDGQPMKVESLAQAKVVHFEAWKRGHRSEVFVASALISTYGKCGSIVDGFNVFNGFYQRNVVSWSAMLAACAQQGQADKALDLYLQMTLECVTPDDRTFVGALQACGLLAEEEEHIVVDGKTIAVQSLGKGKQVHAYAWQKGYSFDLFVGNTLISMYGKCGSIVDAQSVFDRLLQWDVVSWNALLAAYIHQGEEEMALQLFRQMHEEGVSPNDVTFMCLLEACSNTGDLDSCTQIHHHLVSKSKGLSTLMGNTLIHSYGSCASMVDAQKVFDTLSSRDLVSWNALIAGYSRQGDYEASLRCYQNMQVAGVKPDNVTFLSLLSACSHSGRVETGIEHFESMIRDHGITPDIEHYVCMVDLLGSAGYFARVENLLSTMPIPPNLSLWLCLLGTCRKHGEVELAKQAFDCALRIQPEHAAAYVLMSHIYAHAGLWDDAKGVNTLELQARTCKRPGQCWTQHEHEVRVFTVGDHTSPLHRDVYDMLRVVGSEVPKVHP